MYNNNRREHHGAQLYKIQIFYTQLLIITFYNTTNNNINYSIMHHYQMFYKNSIFLISKKEARDD